VDALYLAVQLGALWYEPVVLLWFLFWLPLFFLALLAVGLVFFFARLAVGLVFFFAWLAVGLDALQGSWAPLKAGGENPLRNPPLQSVDRQTAPALEGL